MDKSIYAFQATLYRVEPNPGNGGARPLERELKKDWGYQSFFVGMRLRQGFGGTGGELHLRIFCSDGQVNLHLLGYDGQV